MVRQKKTKRIDITLSKKLIKNLKDENNKTGVPVSRIIARVLEQYFGYQNSSG